MAKKKDIIKILNSNSRDNLSGLTGDNLEVGELALITEADYERLYCKNNDGEVVPIHRILDAGEIEIPKQDYLVYTTTGASQSVQLIYNQQYAKKITLEDGTDVPITGTGSLNYTFADAGNHKVTIEFKEDVTSFSSCFQGCTSLTSIPENLFANCPNATNFTWCFYNCSGLTGSIPENLFASNTAATYFTLCFCNCSGLTGSIPENLFATNTAVDSFTQCFEDCINLTSIPDNLFVNNTAVTSFERCFRSCSGLTGSIPENLFANNTAVTTFSYCFYDCTGLTGKVPVDNDGTPIYNRSGNGKEGYAIVDYYRYCFDGCSGLTDYNSIPSAWGGGGA